MKKKIRFIKAYDQDVLGLGRTFALGDEQEFDNGVADSLITLRIAEAVSDGGDGATQTGARQIVIQLPEGFAPEQVAALKSGASLIAGIDHENYRVEVSPVAENIRASLINDLD